MFPKNLPKLRGRLFSLRPVDWLVYRPCSGPMPHCASAHSSTEGRHCRFAATTVPAARRAARLPRGTRHEGLAVRVRFAKCTVRPRAPCRQYPFERPAGGLLQVPERQKKDRQFGGFASPETPPHSPLALAEDLPDRQSRERDS